jgi:penicillin-binding protein 1C
MTTLSEKLPQPPKRCRRWRRFGVAALLALGGGVVLLVAGFQAAVVFWAYPDSVEHAPRPATFIYDRHGVALAAFAAADGHWRVPLKHEEISPHLINAVVAVEDGRFHGHGGVDWRAAAAAGWQNAKAFGVKRGASTITMQLHRLREPVPRTLMGKLEQSVRAAQIEKRLTKRQILTEYLNRAPFGGNLVGAGAASWRYFDKSCLSLSLGEAALLAGLPQNPNRLRPDRFPERAEARRRHVLDRMLALGMITAEQHLAAAGEPVAAWWRPLPQSGARSEPSPGPMLTIARFHAGRVESTLDAGVQEQASQAARQQLESLAASGVSAVAVVVLDTASAEVRAAVSVCPGNPMLDLTRRPRSTGSALKPFIYAAAFEAGITTPQGVVGDSPAAWPGYAPDNYDGTFRGQMRAADALAESRNIPALALLAKVGPERAAGLMGAAGLETLYGSPQRYGLSLAVGGAEATPLELAQAYATLARGGVVRRASYVVRQGDSGTPPRWMPERACWQTLSCLSDPARTAGVCVEAASPHIAWKTGTSSGHRDAWCAAVTRRFTVVVWMGNADGAGSRSLVGVDVAAPLALRLIASLDPSGEAWQERELSDRGSAEIALRRPALRVVSPADGVELVLDGERAAEAQRVPLRAVSAGLSERERLWWFVDGQPVTGEGGAQPWWQPTPGRHEVRVTDSDGRSAWARVRVRQD